MPPAHLGAWIAALRGRLERAEVAAVGPMLIAPVYELPDLAREVCGTLREGDRWPTCDEGLQARAPPSGSPRPAGDASSTSGSTASRSPPKRSRPRRSGGTAPAGWAPAANPTSVRRCWCTHTSSRQAYASADPARSGSAQARAVRREPPWGTTAARSYRHDPTSAGVGAGRPAPPAVRPRDGAGAWRAAGRAADDRALGPGRAGCRVPAAAGGSGWLGGAARGRQARPGPPGGAGVSGRPRGEQVVGDG
jgi:hypothetical protein